MSDPCWRSCCTLSDGKRNNNNIYIFREVQIIWGVRAPNSTDKGRGDMKLLWSTSTRYNLWLGIISVLCFFVKKRTRYTYWYELTNSSTILLVIPLCEIDDFAEAHIDFRAVCDDKIVRSLRILRTTRYESGYTVIFIHTYLGLDYKRHITQLAKLSTRYQLYNQPNSQLTCFIIL